MFICRKNNVDRVLYHILKIDLKGGNCIINIINIICYITIDNSLQEKYFLVLSVSEDT